MNIVITGYYYEKNLGDDLFLQIAEKIFRRHKLTKYNIITDDIQFIKIDSIMTNKVRGKCNKIILFGGETLNSYFIDKLIRFKTKHKCDVYGIGVSCNQLYEELANKINIFDYLVFRNKKDYEYFYDKFKNYCTYVPDIVFMIKNRLHLPLINFKSNRVGFFPATPMFIGLNNLEKNNYLKSIKKIVDYWINKNYIIHFFCMSNSNKQNEDDLFLIKKIINLYPKNKKEMFRLCESNNNIFTEIKKMKYNICWRFHSIILSIINRIPFITFSSTPKVKNLLKDNLIEDLCYTFNSIDKGFEYLKNNRNNIIKKIDKIYKINHNISTKFYKDFSYINLKRSEPPFYINNTDIKKLIDTYCNIYKAFRSEIDENNDYNCNIILYNLNRTIDSDYHFGLKEKLYKGIHNLHSELKWLINDNIIKNNILFYYAANSILKKIQINNKRVNKINKRVNKINMYFINQFDMRGLHRSGWTYVLDNLTFLQDINGIYCDFYLDRTFHWNNLILSRLKHIPYKQNWIGFIHHTTNEEYSDYNTINLFKNVLFIKSLKYCKGLILLTEHLKNEVELLMVKMDINIPLFVLTHPTEFVEETKMFSMNNFKLNEEKKIIQIGAWMRDINAIFQIKINNESNIQKAVLIGKKMEGYYSNLNHNLNDNLNTNNNSITPTISRDNKIRRVIINEEKNQIINVESNDNEKVNEEVINGVTNGVKIITFQENGAYDELLSKNIVFLKLIDASAINTLLECIVRATPIVINKIKPVVEVLGESYPLFYLDISEVKNLVTNKNIKKAHNYLKRMDKTQFKIETFIKNFQNILNQIIIE
jgi:hypothetical protein